MTVPDDGRRTRQRQLAGDLRALILAGDIAPGARLPSTAELRDRYGVNNMTITRAMAILKAEGLVEGYRGKSVVATDKKPAVVRASHYPTVSPAVRLLSVAEEPAPAQVAAAFGVSAGDPVVVRTQVAMLAETPAELLWSYYPTAIARGNELAGPHRLAGGSLAVLAALGLPVRAVVDQVSVRPATIAEFTALDLPGDVPVLRQFRVAYAAGGQAVEATVMIKAGQQFEITYEVPLG